ncbi:MAG: aldolase/citrate lyase family protein, partial [Pseudomonadota bacterium]
ESPEAVANVEEIITTPGVGAIFIGPSDLSANMGLPASDLNDRKDFARRVQGPDVGLGEVVAVACAPVPHGVSRGSAAETRRRKISGTASLREAS